MKKIFTIGLMAIIVLALFNEATYAEEKETVVSIETNYGKIKVRLFNDTPLHRDNFIKNIKDHLYDGLLFHRVIKQFIIQGGDINSKDAPLEQVLGDGDPAYTVPAEIVYPKYFHKTGMLGAARTEDKVNPQRESSGSQFYIVTGTFYTSMELDKFEKENGVKLTPEQRESYMLKGGVPHLDNKYTLFGEVIDGMKTLMKIQNLETNEYDRPLQNVKIKKIKILKK